MDRNFIGVGGIVLILSIAVLLSSDRRAIRLRVVVAAFALQATIATLVLHVPLGRMAVAGMSHGIANLLGYAGEGTRLLFGSLAEPPFGNRIFAIGALPVIIFFSSLVSVLYYLGIMQQVVRWVGGAIKAVTGVSRVESLCAAANIFVGQSESPLVIKPYLAGLTLSQLFLVMTSGMAGVAGTILAAYASQGINIEYLLAASFMAAPGGILMAKIIMPDDPHAPDPDAGTPAVMEFDHGDEKPVNIIMAAASGAQTGVRLAVAVGAMVLSFVALVALANGLLRGICGWFGYADVTFQALLGHVFAPVMFMIGVPWHDAGIAGGLFGTKVVLNEFVAFIQLGQMKDLSPHTVAIVTFALCGFANFLSIAIQIAVTGSLAPNQRPVIARLGLKALAAGSLANLMSAALAGLLIPQ